MKPLDPVGVDRHFTYFLEIWTAAIGRDTASRRLPSRSANPRAPKRRHRLGKVRISAGRQDRAAAKSNKGASDLPTNAAVTSGHRVYELPPALDLNVAGPLAEALLKHSGEDLVIDGSKVQRLGASCLQVLLAAARTWASEGDALSLENPTPRLVEDLRLLGFDALTFLDGATPQ